MNFKTIKKVGLSALLAGTFAFSAEESFAAPASKEPANATLTAKQANMRMRRSFAEQEKLLTAEQKELWQKFKSHPDFDKILPEIKMNMDITKIYKSNEDHVGVPVEMAESIFGEKAHDRGSMGVLKSVDRILGGGHALRFSIHYFVNEDYIVPEYDVPSFVKYQNDCYFYTPKSELDNLSEKEQEYIQTLDKALNAVYHHIYGRGFAKVDVDKLAKGKMAGWIYDVHKLSTRFGKRLNSDSKWVRQETQKQFAHWLEGRSDLELKFYDVLDYPLSMQDYVKASQVSPIYFMHFGGCDGEINYSMEYSSQFGIPDAVDISKDKKRLNKVLYQMGLRQTNQIMYNSEQLDEKIKNIQEDNLPNASEKFKQLLDEKVKTVRIYNKKLFSTAEKLNIMKLPGSMAETKALDSYIKKNYDLKMSDEKKAAQPQKLGKQTVGQAVYEKKNLQLGRGIE